MILTDQTARQLQTVLKSLNLYTDEIDGQVGPLTISATQELGEKLSMTPVVTRVTPLPAGLTLLQSAILTAAKRFVGLSEIKPNERWDDLSTPGPDKAAADLRIAMRALGWNVGEAYCIAGAETVWQAGFAGAMRAADFLPYGKLISVSVLSSFNNLSAAGKTTLEPKLGAIFFMQNGSKSTGHAGIVTAVHADRIETIEFNTSPTSADLAKDREGDGVYAKSRPLSFKKTSGLWLRGFCNPPV